MNKINWILHLMVGIAILTFAIIAISETQWVESLCLWINGIPAGVSIGIFISELKR